MLHFVIQLSTLPVRDSSICDATKGAEIGYIRFLAMQRFVRGNVASQRLTGERLRR